MNLSSYLVERAMRLGPPQTRDLTVQRDRQVPILPVRMGRRECAWR